MTSSMRLVFDQKYTEIRDNLLRMGQLLDAAIERSLTALKNQDVNLARQVIADDTAINDLRFTVEEECLALIATQQPAASDLRAVIAAMNLVNDMERMADHATGVAKTVLRMGAEPLLKPLGDIPKMADFARDMLRRSLDAFLAHDVEAARAIAMQDDEIDRLYKAVFDELLQIMIKDPTTVTRATYLLWCAHNLERIGDRVTNIAERVVFLTTGTMMELNVKPGFER
ncbi:MAG TPA: phosphate signaling complex protein PhoU [Anaerolineales bacterium]|nr:phosphate signaling complex protein PhoU [Anaerolineales bacterium]